MEDADPRYREILGRLQARGRFGIRLGLDRTHALLARLGDPHKELRGALIGGTNGKGSTQQLVASVLREAGYRVGQTPKPHLVSYRERIVVDGEPISSTDFADVVEEVLEQAEGVEAQHGAPTEFEVLTAAAFEWFRRSNVDVAVVEVGLGGRLDATNVWDGGEQHHEPESMWEGGVTAITNVELDHMEYLGDTIEAIAKEKAAIIKPGNYAAITGAADPALSVIADRAKLVDVYLEQRQPWEVTRVDRTGTFVRTEAELEFRLGLLGRHQAANASVAFGILAALERSSSLGLYASPEQFDRGFANARWPGRMELISVPGQPDILLDGAHNPAGMAALGSALTELLPQMTAGSPTFLIGILANHWQEGMLDPVIDAVPSGALFATRVPGAENSLDPRKLASIWGAGAVEIAVTERAWDSARQRAAQVSGPLIVCGSLYLVGDIRARLMAAGALD